jgi:biotin carboxyl carrier protein
MSEAGTTNLAMLDQLLSADEICLIGSLCDALDRSGLTSLQVQSSRLQVCLAKGKLPFETFAGGQPPTPAEEVAAIDVTASSLGVFHADGVPLVAGNTIEADTVIGSLVVLDCHRPVSARVAGMVAEVCVEHGQFVEYEQILCRVRPV